MTTATTTNDRDPRRHPLWFALGFHLARVNSWLERYSHVAKERALSADEAWHRAELLKWQEQHMVLYERIRLAPDDDPFEWFAMALIDLGEPAAPRVPVPVPPSRERAPEPPQPEPALLERLHAAEREVKVLQGVLLALVPNRHAVGQILGGLTFGENGETFFRCLVTVPLDQSDDESVSRKLTEALMPELHQLAALLERSNEGAVVSMLRSERESAARKVEAHGERRDWEGAADASTKVEAIDLVLELITNMHKRAGTRKESVDGRV